MLLQLGQEFYLLHECRLLVENSERAGVLCAQDVLGVGADDAVYVPLLFVHLRVEAAEESLVFEPVCDAEALPHRVNQLIPDAALRHERLVSGSEDAKQLLGRARFFGLVVRAWRLGQSGLSLTRASGKGHRPARRALIA